MNNSCTIKPGARKFFLQSKNHKARANKPFFFLLKGKKNFERSNGASLNPFFGALYNNYKRQAKQNLPYNSLQKKRALKNLRSKFFENKLFKSARLKNSFLNSKGTGSLIWTVDQRFGGGSARAFLQIEKKSPSLFTAKPYIYYLALQRMQNPACCFCSQKPENLVFKEQSDRTGDLEKNENIVSFPQKNPQKQSGSGQALFSPPKIYGPETMPKKAKPSFSLLAGPKDQKRNKKIGLTLESKLPIFDKKYVYLQYLLYSSVGGTFSQFSDASYAALKSQTYLFETRTFNNLPFLHFEEMQQASFLFSGKNKKNYLGRAANQGFHHFNLEEEGKENKASLFSSWARALIIKKSALNHFRVERKQEKRALKQQIFFKKNAKKILSQINHLPDQKNYKEPNSSLFFDHKGGGKNLIWGPKNCFGETRQNFNDSAIAFQNLSDKVLRFANFFPHKKTFLCYWLLPFVGFVSCIPTVCLKDKTVDQSPKFNDYKDSNTYLLSSFYSCPERAKKIKKKTFYNLPFQGKNKKNWPTDSTSQTLFLGFFAFSSKMQDKTGKVFAFSLQKKKEVLQMQNKKKNFQNPKTNALLGVRSKKIEPNAPNFIFKSFSFFHPLDIFALLKNNPGQEEKRIKKECNAYSVQRTEDFDFLAKQFFWPNPIPIFREIDALFQRTPNFDLKIRQGQFFEIQQRSNGARKILLKARAQKKGSWTISSFPKRIWSPIFDQFGNHVSIFSSLLTVPEIQDLKIYKTKQSSSFFKKQSKEKNLLPFFLPTYYNNQPVLSYQKASALLDTLITYYTTPSSIPKNFDVAKSFPYLKLSFLCPERAIINRTPKKTAKILQFFVTNYKQKLENWSLINLLKNLRTQASNDSRLFQEKKKVCPWFLFFSSLKKPKKLFGEKKRRFADVQFFSFFSNLKSDEKISNLVDSVLLSFPNKNFSEGGHKKPHANNNDKRALQKKSKDTQKFQSLKIWPKNYSNMPLNHSIKHLQQEQISNNPYVRLRAQEVYNVIFQSLKKLLNDQLFSTLHLSNSQYNTLDTQYDAFSSFLNFKEEGQEIQNNNSKAHIFIKQNKASNKEGLLKKALFKKNQGQIFIKQKTYWVKDNKAPKQSAKKFVWHDLPRQNNFLFSVNYKEPNHPKASFSFTERSFGGHFGKEGSAEKILFSTQTIFEIWQKANSPIFSTKQMFSPFCFFPPKNYKALKGQDFFLQNKNENKEINQGQEKKEQYFQDQNLNNAHTNININQVNGIGRKHFFGRLPNYKARFFELFARAKNSKILILNDIAYSGRKTEEARANKNSKRASDPFGFCFVFKKSPSLTEAKTEDNFESPRNLAFSLYLNLLSSYTERIKRFPILGLFLKAKKSLLKKGKETPIAQNYLDDQIQILSGARFNELSARAGQKNDFFEEMQKRSNDLARAPNFGASKKDIEKIFRSFLSRRSIIRYTKKGETFKPSFLRYTQLRFMFIPLIQSKKSFLFFFSKNKKIFAKNLCPNLSLKNKNKQRFGKKVKARAHKKSKIFLADSLDKTNSLAISSVFASKKEALSFPQKKKDLPAISPTLLIKNRAFIDKKVDVWRAYLTNSSKECKKKKYLQKKRRKKKQKRETRRAKKRKRFYPRPIWSRFRLYKKFLSLRHSKFSLVDKNSQFNNSPLQPFNPYIRDSQIKVKWAQKWLKSTIWTSPALKAKTNFWAKINPTYLNIKGFKKSLLHFSRNAGSSGAYNSYKAPESAVFAFLSYRSPFFQRNQGRAFFFQARARKKILLYRRTSPFFFLKAKKIGFANSCISFYKLPENKKEMQQASLLFSGKKNKKCNNSNNLNSKKSWFLSSNSGTYSPAPVLNKEFFNISRTVLGDLKRLFWKSYWLRSHLNPYLSRVKTYLKQIKEYQKKLQCSDINNQSHKAKSSNFLNGPFYSKNFWGTQQTIVLVARKRLRANAQELPQNTVRRAQIIQKSARLQPNLRYKFFGRFLFGRAKQYNQIYCEAKHMLENQNNWGNTWQTTINISEYNRIIYQRIQQYILNIRENIHLNGEKKARSYHIGHKKLQVAKQSKDFWIKFGKTITFENPPSPKMYYGDIPKLRMYWAINKTNYGSFKDINQRNSLWSTQKVRDQVKSNKTKKILQQIFQALTRQKNRLSFTSNPKNEENRSFSSFFAFNTNFGKEKIDSFLVNSANQQNFTEPTNFLSVPISWARIWVFNFLRETERESQNSKSMNYKIWQKNFLSINPLIPEKNSNSYFISRANSNLKNDSALSPSALLEICEKKVRTKEEKMQYNGFNFNQRNINNQHKLQSSFLQDQSVPNNYLDAPDFENNDLAKSPTQFFGNRRFSLKLVNKAAPRHLEKQYLRHLKKEFQKDIASQKTGGYTKNQFFFRTKKYASKTKYDLYQAYELARYLEDKSFYLNTPFTYGEYTNNFNYWWSYKQINTIPIFNQPFLKNQNDSEAFNLSLKQTQQANKGKNNKVDQFGLGPANSPKFILEPINLFGLLQIKPEEENSKKPFFLNIALLFIKSKNSEAFLEAKGRNNKDISILACTFLFHFCAILSLISFSQIRGLLKFYFVCLSKISNAYAHIINSIYNGVSGPIYEATNILSRYWNTQGFFNRSQKPFFKAAPLIEVSSARFNELSSRAFVFWQNLNSKQSFKSISLLNAKNQKIRKNSSFYTNKKNKGPIKNNDLQARKKNYNGQKNKWSKQLFFEDRKFKLSERRKSLNNNAYSVQRTEEILLPLLTLSLKNLSHFNENSQIHQLRQWILNFYYNSFLGAQNLNNSSVLTREARFFDFKDKNLVKKFWTQQDKNLYNTIQIFGPFKNSKRVLKQEEKIGVQKLHLTSNSFLAKNISKYIYYLLKNSIAKCFLTPILLLQFRPKKITNRRFDLFLRLLKKQKTGKKEKARAEKFAKQIFLKQAFQHFEEMQDNYLRTPDNSNSFGQIVDLPPANKGYKALQILKIYQKLTTISIINFAISSFYKTSFLTYTYLLKSVDLLEIFMRSIYMFLEKPGELIVDWIAYLFLVEWSADLTTTIPENLDMVTWNSFVKNTRLTRIAFGFNLSNQLFSAGSLIQAPLAFLLGGSLIQRRIWNFYEIFIEQLCQPDMDLIVRQRKGIIFWDIWSEYFIKVAEESNINLSEYSNNVQSNIEEEEQLHLWAKKIDQLAKTDFITNPLFLKTWGWSGKSLFALQKMKFPFFVCLQKKQFERKTASLKKEQPSKFALGFEKKGQEKTSFFGGALNNYNGRAQNLGPINRLSALSAPSNKFEGRALALKKHKNSQRALYPFKFFENKLSVLPVAIPNWKRWSATQFLSYQGKDSELFIDLHPPKSFSQITSLKYSKSGAIEQPIGTLVCQIFSGIFYKQTAKNMLVVGSPGIEKTLLIQAIAGETELKIITDNAHRYAMVYRGVAVGIKLLRDVFDALALHSPCLFLMEDIHIIGERRPFLISDDENTKGTESSFGSEREEIHEKNQVIYQLSKHFISHYKKPYKGDFSLLIPTNHFCFDLFRGASPIRTRRSNVTPASPLPIDSLGENALSLNEKNGDANSPKNFGDQIKASSLQLRTNQLLAPPATSPFSVLVLKEEKKFKSRNLVKEIPWSGMAGEQLSLISKANYSIRVKVALLAEMALANLSVKLDMITDLLVIIDSVKANRGFVVFATTHVPYVLDPALRRPGRLDETISLPIIPTLFSRWEILQSNLGTFLSSFGFLPFSFFCIKGKKTKGTTLDFVNILQNKIQYNMNFGPAQIPLNILQSPNFEKYQKNILFLAFLRNAKKQGAPAFLNLPFLHFEEMQQTSFSCISSKCKETKGKHKKENEYFAKQKTYLNLTAKTYYRASHILISTNLTRNCLLSASVSSSLKKRNKKQKIDSKKKQNFFFGDFKEKEVVASQINDLVLNKKIDFENALNNDLTLSQIKNLEGETGNIAKSSSKTNFAVTQKTLLFMSLYASPKNLKQHFISLIAGKLGELFALSYNYKSSPARAYNNYKRAPNGFMTLSGIDQTWRSATSLLFSFIQKRYLYSKNLIVPRLLCFINNTSLHEYPSPPASNILLPAKRYENYKRTFNAQQIKRKAYLGIQEKIQMHQQQRLVKRLYKLPIREYFRSEIIENSFTGFGNSAIILAPLEGTALKKIEKPSSINWYYKNRVLNRHRNYLNNQWWNGQLPEHNTETTFLSDIDWRYTFIKSIGDILIDFPDSDQHYNARQRRWMLNFGDWNYWQNFESRTLLNKQRSNISDTRFARATISNNTEPLTPMTPKEELEVNTTEDLVLKPNNYLGTQLFTQKRIEAANISESMLMRTPNHSQINNLNINQIYLHYIYDCFIQAYNFLDKNREILDFYAATFLQNGMCEELKEIQTFKIFKRF